jgi:hypothetical protein
MKIAGIILAALMLFGAAFVGVTGSNKSMDLGKDIAALSGSLSEAELAESGLPSAGRLKVGGIVGILAALGSVALLVVTFVRKEKIPVVAIAALGLSAVAIVLYPGMETGPMDGMAPRPQAMLAAALTFIGAGGAFMAKKGADRA